MTQWIVPIVVALIASTPGFLVWLRDRRLGKVTQTHVEREDRRKDDAQTIGGLVRLVGEQRKELDAEYVARARDKADCDRRMAQMKNEFLHKIVELESRLQDAGIA